MTEPIVYVSTLRIKQGRFADYLRFSAELVKIVDRNEPRVTAFLAFANEEMTEITNVHVFPDTETLDHHMSVLAEKMGLLPDDLRGVTRFLEPVAVAVYGRPGGEAARMDKALADSGVRFTGKQRYVGGFTRQP